MTADDWARPVVHFEIVARDVDALSHFYEWMFQWPIGEGFIRQFPAGLGAPEGGPAGHIRHGDATGVTLYIQVRDLRESLDRAVTLGGAITLEPLDIPDGPTIAGITDPEGNAVTLVQQ